MKIAYQLASGGHLRDGASLRLIDAVNLAPYAADVVCLVDVDGANVAADVSNYVTMVCRRRTILTSFPIDLRRSVRLACECAALACGLAGCDAAVDLLIVAARDADRGDFEAAVASADAAVASAHGDWAADRAAHSAADATAWAAGYWGDAARGVTYGIGTASRAAYAAALGPGGVAAGAACEARAKELLLCVGA